MVLPPSVADDAPGPDIPNWIRRIKVILGLSSRGVLVWVDQAHPEQLGPLVRVLVPDYPELEVHTEARRLPEVRPGSTLVLVPRPEDADWLNINRPIFAMNALRVVVFCPPEASVALSRNAVDFLDWISHRIVCPTGPARFAVAGLRCASALRVPGIVWRGGDLEAAFRAARPRRKLRRVSAARPYEELVTAAQEARGAWLAWTDVEGEFELRRVRWALAEARRRTRSILVEPGVRSPGWWEVHGRIMELRAACERLERAGAVDSGRLAALMDLEPEAVELLAALLEQGLSEQVLDAEMTRGPDAGATIGRLAAAHGLVLEKELVYGKAPPPAMRAFSRDRRKVHRLRKVEVEAVRQRLEQGERLEPEEVTWWAASTTKTFPFWVSNDGLGRRGDVAEVWLRQEWRDARDWERLASAALLAGDSQVAHLWAQRAAQLDPQRWKVLAQVLTARGRWAEAETLFRQKLTSTSSQERAWILHALALVLERQGRYVEAEQLLRQGLAINAKALGETHPEYAASLQELAQVLERQGRYVEAEQMLRQVLASHAEAPGKTHPYYAASLLVLARALEGQGRYVEAEQLLRQGLAIYAKALGETHPYYATTLQVLARVLERQGRYVEAEQLLRQGLAIYAKALGETHSYYAKAQRELARVLERRGQYTEAEGLLRQVLALEEQALGAEHPDLCSALTLLGFTLIRQNRPQEAEPLLRRSIEIALKTWGPHHPTTAQALHRLAQAQAALEKKEATATAQQAVDALLKSLGPEHPLTKEALPSLNLILEGRG